MKPYNSTYSLFAFSQENGETVSYLTELKDGNLRVLYKLREEYAFYGILPVPVEIKGKPVLLLHIILLESDAVDDYVVATYDGAEYRLLENYRIKLE